MLADLFNYTFQPLNTTIQSTAVPNKASSGMGHITDVGEDEMQSPGHIDSSVMDMLLNMIKSLEINQLFSWKLKKKLDLSSLSLSLSLSLSVSRVLKTI